MTYRVEYDHHEYDCVVIEAASVDEARDKVEEMWEDGDLDFNDGTFRVLDVVEVESEPPL